MMLRRTLASVCCCFAIGASALSALAATAADDAPVRGGDRGSIALEPRTAQPTQEPAASANPLWAIPLNSLSITRERPLFTPSRRPPAPAVIAPPPRVVPPKIVASPPPPERLSLTLIGTVVGESEGIGVFLDPATHNFVRLKIGEGHGGWILRSVKSREATLEKAQRKETLRLPTPQLGAQAPAQ